MLPIKKKNFTPIVILEILCRWMKIQTLSTELFYFETGFTGSIIPFSEINDECVNRATSYLQTRLNAITFDFAFPHYNYFTINATVRWSLEVIFSSVISSPAKKTTRSRSNLDKINTFCSKKTSSHKITNLLFFFFCTSLREPVSDKRFLNAVSPPPLCR